MTLCGALRRAAEHRRRARWRLTTASINEPQRTRQRAYTLLVRSYDECRRGIAYLRARFGDAETITPSLYVKQRKRSAGSQVDDELPEVPPAPSRDQPLRITAWARAP